MKDNIKPELMKLLGITDDKIADDVITYVQSLTMIGRRADDFALAKALNERASQIVSLVADNIRHGDGYKLEGTTAINRSYILLVNELKKLYTRNKELLDISVSPAWREIDVIEGNAELIDDYVWERQNGSGQSHNAQVNKLAIIVGNETLTYTPELKKIIADADEAIADYKKALEANISKMPKKVESDDWQFIPEYKLHYADDGSIIVNDVLKLKKTQSGSAPRKLMEQVVKQPNTLFKPNLGQAYSRRLSSMLSDMGIIGTLKSLFFPVVSDSNGIRFRPVVSQATAKSERLDTIELDMKLKELGAYTEIDPSHIPF